MKNLACVFLACALVLSFSVPGFCNKDSYATGLIGASVPLDSDVNRPDDPDDVEISYDVGLIVGVAVGHDFGNYRFEGEFAYLTNELDERKTTFSYGGSNTQDVDSTFSLFTVLLNGYYEFSGSGDMTPYLTAGFGLGSAEFSGDDYSEQDAVTVVQVGAGISFFLSEFTVIDIRYRYLVTSDIEIDDVDVDFASHNVLFGISKRF